MLALIDYGAGNLRSVLHALEHLGYHEVTIVRHADDWQAVDQLILPGVGAFGAGMQQLKQRGLVPLIRSALDAGIPYLGICLGMQFLFDYSDEMGEHAGLGILSGRVVRLPHGNRLKVPHVGWNDLCVTRDSALSQHLPKQAFAYFVHSYHCVPTDQADVIMTVNYGDRVTAAVNRDHIYGVQFHPEKSQRVGLQILRNFLEHCV